MRVFKTRDFARFARRERITDVELCEAIARAESGLIDAVLGGGLIKQRIARKGQGRSGGFRTIIAYRSADRSFFMYGFAKNERENIGQNDLISMKQIATSLMALSERQREVAIVEGELEEIGCDA